MNINYLKGRFEHAKALESDVVKIDIEEMASLLEWIDGEHERIVDATEHGYILGRKEILNSAIRELEKLKEGDEE